MPAKWKRETLETFKDKIINHGAKIVQKSDKSWTIRINKEFMFKFEVESIYKSIKQDVYFFHYANLALKTKDL